MSIEEIALVATITISTITRFILNNIIYRNEYNYHDYTDGVATWFDKESIEKRDNGVILFVLALFTFFWVKSHPDKTKKIWAHCMSVIFIIAMAVFLFISY